MTTLRFLLTLPAAIARDVWQWVIEDVPCRFANQTNEDPHA